MKKRKKAKKQKRRSATTPWKKFEGLFRGIPLLKDDAIYALPADLLCTIQDHAPGFFQGEEFHFEIELANNSGHGFFLKFPFRHPLLYRNNEEMKQLHKTKNPETTERLKNIKRMLIDDMQKRKFRDDEIADFYEQRSIIEASCDIRRQGFAGWLVTEPGFQLARARYLTEWEVRIRKNGYFEKVPLVFCSDPPFGIETKKKTTAKKKSRTSRKTIIEERKYPSDSIQFYRDWNLEGLVTWNLPVPLQPQITSTMMYPASVIEEAGANLFIPWFMLADRNLKISELTDHRRLIDSSPELKGWIDPPKKWGYERYAIMFQLYVFRELALKRRYGGLLRSKIQKLDEAFAAYFYPDEYSFTKVDTIKKIRQKMKSRLKACHEAFE